MPLKHGLCGNAHAALPGEEGPSKTTAMAFAKHTLRSAFPKSNLVRNLAENHWRLKRAHAMESALFVRMEREPPANSRRRRACRSLGRSR